MKPDETCGGSRLRPSLKLGGTGLYCHSFGMDDEKYIPIPAVPAATDRPEKANETPARPREIGGPKGPEPTRYGDWEIGGRCTDF